MKRFIRILLLFIFLAILIYGGYRFWKGVWIRVKYGEVVLLVLPSNNGIRVLHTGNYFIREGFIPDYTITHRYPVHIYTNFKLIEYPPLVEFLHIKDDMAIIFNINIRHIAI